MTANLSSQAMSLRLLAESDSGGGMGGAIGWSLVLILLVFGAFYGVMRLRRWLKEEDVPAGGIGFSLGDLRQLHREGKITAEEYEKARSKMVAAGKAMAEKLPDPLARHRPPGTPPQNPGNEPPTGFPPQS